MKTMIHSIAMHVEKTNMFNALHTVTDLLRKTCNLKYTRIYTESRVGYYRCKIYNCNIQKLNEKKLIRLQTIINSVMTRSGYKVDISIDTDSYSYSYGCITNLIIKIYAK